jgi:predicted RND superfamily exporter protein
MRTTLAAVAPAMLSTSIVLVLGFGVLTLSAFQMTAHLGWLSLLVVGIAPIADLVLVPALVLVFATPRLSPKAGSARPTLDSLPVEVGAT